MGYSYDRTAAGADTLLAAKIAWSKTVAEKAVKHFKSGGWDNHQTKSDIDVFTDGIGLAVRSERYGWTGHARFNMSENPPNVHANVLIDNRDKGADVNLLRLLEQLSDDTKVIPIHERDKPDDVVMAISLWFSRTVNKIPT